MGYWLMDLIKQFQQPEPKRVVVKAPNTRNDGRLLSLKELFDTYNSGYVFEYEDFKEDMQKHFGSVASNILISYDDYDSVVEGLMDYYSYEKFRNWLKYRIEKLNVDLSKDKVKLVRSQSDQLTVEKV